MTQPVRQPHALPNTSCTRPGRFFALQPSAKSQRQFDVFFQRLCAAAGLND